MNPLLVGIADGIATLTMNRPNALNALNVALREGLVKNLRELDVREDVQVIILTGNGRAFCAGLDVKELSTSGRNVTENLDGCDIGGTLTGMKTPVIAAINGLAVTGGFEIALACDMILAAESAWFQDTHAKIGLLPGWGLSQRLQRVIGPYRAKEISLSARKVTALEAATLGFVNRAVPDQELLAEALALATSIIQWPSKGTQRIKELIDTGYGLAFAEALDYEVLQSRQLNSEVSIEAKNRSEE